MAAKRTIWVVKAYQGIKGWEDFKTFTSPRAADEWLCNFVRENGYLITDFNIVRREA